MTDIKTPQPSKIVKELFDAGAHFAFIKSRRHPTAKKYIFGKKSNIEIFDLEKTEVKLEEAKAFIAEIVKKSGSILLIGGKKEAQKTVRDMGQALDIPYVAGRWIGGTLTNYTEIKIRIKRLEDLTTQKEKGELGKYTKKERLLIDREIERLERFYRGLVPMDKIPQLMIVIDSKFEKIAVDEAHEAGVPVIGICGSDCNLNEVDIAIPANDALVKSIAYIMGEIKKTIEATRITLAAAKKE